MKILKQTIASIALASFCISTSAKPAQSNPAVLAPAAFCAGTAGIGCVLIGVATVGGVTYYVWQNSKKRTVASDRNGNVVRSEQINGASKPMQSRSMSAIDAAKIGDAHWVTSPDRCNRSQLSQGRKLKVSPPPKAHGGGYWCIY